MNLNLHLADMLAVLVFFATVVMLGLFGLVSMIFMVIRLNNVENPSFRCRPVVQVLLVIFLLAVNSGWFYRFNLWFKVPGNLHYFDESGWSFLLIFVWLPVNLILVVVLSEALYQIWLKTPSATSLSFINIVIK